VKVEKLAKIGQMVQNCYPLSPGRESPPAFEPPGTTSTTSTSGVLPSSMGDNTSAGAAGASPPARFARGEDSRDRASRAAARAARAEPGVSAGTEGSGTPRAETRTYPAPAMFEWGPPVSAGSLVLLGSWRSSLWKKCTVRARFREISAPLTVFRRIWASSTDQNLSSERKIGVRRAFSELGGPKTVKFFGAHIQNSELIFCEKTKVKSGGFDFEILWKKIKNQKQFSST